MVYNDLQKKLISRNSDIRLSHQKEIPKFTFPKNLNGVAYAGNNFKKRRVTKLHQFDLKRINFLYVETRLFGSEFLISGPNSDIPLIDWQYRVIKFLKERGHQVTIKVHPESQQPIPDGMLEQLNIKKIGGKFEDVAEDFDALIFDWKTTSTFSYAFGLARPIFLFDFPNEILDVEVKEIITPNCNLIKGFVNQDTNRLDINWNDLSRSLESPTLCMPLNNAIENLFKIGS